MVVSEGGRARVRGRRLHELGRVLEERMVSRSYVLRDAQARGALLRPTLQRVGVDVAPVERRGLAPEGVAWRHGEPQPLPEPLLAPAQDGGGAEVGPELEVALGLVHDRAGLHDDELPGPAAQCLVQGRSELEARPLGLQEIAREHDDDALGGLRGLEDDGRRRAQAGQVAVVEAEPQTADPVLQLDRQGVQHEVFVLGAVAEVAVVEALLVLGHRGLRPEAHAVPRVGPGAHGLAEYEREHGQDEQEQDRRQGGGHHGQVVRDHDALDDAALGEVIRAGSLVDVQSAAVGRPSLVVVAPHVVGIDDLVRVVGHPGGELLQELAAAGPGVAAQRQLRESGIQADLPDGEGDQPVTVQPEDLERVQRVEREIADVADEVVLQVELAQVRQVLELEALELVDAVVLEVEHLQIVQPVEGAVLNGLDAAAVHVEHAHVLATDEHVVLQLAQIVAVEINLGGVHGYPSGDLAGTESRAVDDVSVPGLIVIALAVRRAGHLAVAGVKVAAVAEGEAVSLVATQKLFRFGHGGGHYGCAAGSRNAAHRVVEVHHTGMLAQSTHVVDDWQPVHGAVAVEGVAANIELWQKFGLRHGTEAQRSQLHGLDHVGVHVNAGEVDLAREGIGPHDVDVIVVDEQQLDAVGH